MLLSPNSFEAQPPSLGISLAVLARTLITSAAQVIVAIWSSPNVPRFFAKLLIWVPRVGRYAPNVPRPLSPNIFAAQPPSLGISFAALAIVATASEAHRMELTWSWLNSPRFPANVLRSLPSWGSWALKLPREESPKIPNGLLIDSIKSAAVRASTASARVLMPIIMLWFWPRAVAPSIKSLQLDMNSERLVPREGRESLNGLISSILSINPAAPNAIIAPARIPAPPSTSPLMPPSPVMNPWHSSMKSLSASPIAGSKDMTPIPIP